MKKVLMQVCLMLAVLTASAEVVLQRGTVEVRNTPSGWQMVDSQSGKLLAYGESQLQAGQLAPVFVDMVEGYAANAQQSTSNSQLSTKKRVTYKDIEPLLTCHWAQDDPFNRLAPSFNGSTSHTKAGCVAVAMAQIMYYHKLPVNLHGTKTYSYTSDEGLKGADGSNTITMSDNLANYIIDWPHLIDSPWSRYTGTASCTEAEGKAVATLMYVCGMITEMHYGYKGSGASVAVAAQGINTYIDGLQAEHVEFNEQTIITELSKGNPLMYSGGGHCFVVDGASAAGYLHCNLGWGGGGEVGEDGTQGNPDGYYLPDVMAGYTANHSLVKIWKDGTRTPYKPGDLILDPQACYTLKNTGYSQGYLVATSEGDQHPTLRGVTQDHANGLYKGAAYHDAAQLGQAGAHWKVQVDGNNYYLYNELTQKYLANTGNQTSYVFTATKTPIRIAAGTGGTITLNSGTDSKSYLCAATHLENPAAFWTADDAGSVWQIEAAEHAEGPDGPDPGPEPDERTEIIGTNAATLADISESERYVLVNVGYDALLCAADGEAAYPSVCNLSSTQQGGQEAYYTPANVADDGLYWQFRKVNPSATGDNWYYLYNCATEQCLKFSTDQYVFTSEPTPLHVVSKGNSNFTFNWGEGLSQSGYADYLTMNISGENPAGKGGNSAGNARLWHICKLDPTTGMVAPVTPGASSSISQNREVAITVYNLQGVCVGTTASGIYISGGKKIIK